MELKNVPIEKVKSGVYDLRAKYDGPETDLLVGSIRRRGIINPITVAVEGDAYSDCRTQAAVCGEDGRSGDDSSGDT